jgi:hypothetical protein
VAYFFLLVCGECVKDRSIKLPTTISTFLHHLVTYLYSLVSMCLATGWTTGRSRFDPRQRREDLFSGRCVRTGCGAHPASCTVGTGGPSPGLKRGRGMTLTTHPHLVPRSRMSRSYIPLHPISFLACSGWDSFSFIHAKWVVNTSRVTLVCRVGYSVMTH